MKNSFILFPLMMPRYLANVFVAFINASLFVVLEKLIFQPLMKKATVTRSATLLYVSSYLIPIFVIFTNTTAFVTFKANPVNIYVSFNTAKILDLKTFNFIGRLKNVIIFAWHGSAAP